MNIKQISLALLLGLMLCGVTAKGQVSVKEVIQVTTDITGASTCATGKIYYNATSLVNWERNNAGVCAKITSGGTPGTVTTTGSPASPQLAKFSSATAITTATAVDVSTPLFCSDAGSTDVYACNIAPTPTLVTGTHYRFKANTANTGAATINFNSLGAKNIVKMAGGITTALADNDIRAGQWVDVTYDGTNMQMVSQVGNAGGGDTPQSANTVFAGPASDPGQIQIETATIVGAITGSGNARVIVTAAGMANSPKTIDVAVLNGDSNIDVAGKIAAALQADPDVGAFFSINPNGDPGDGTYEADANTVAANDPTMNFSSANGTCTGLTAQPTSANTQPGVASTATPTFRALVAGDIPNIDAAKLTSGTLPSGRFPAILPAVSGVNLTALPAEISAIINSDTIRTITPGAGNIGFTNNPFASLWLGNAINNTVRLTGTFTANRVATFPDQTGTVLVTTTNPASGTGNQTVNATSFIAKFAAAATSLTITNSFIASTSAVICTVQTNDATLKSVQAVPASGSVTLFGSAAATGTTNVGCLVVP